MCMYMDDLQTARWTESERQLDGQTAGMQVYTQTLAAGGVIKMISL